MAGKVNRKHMRFVDEYLTCFNGTQAYMRVYPNCTEETARRSASRLLTNEDVKAELEARLAEVHMSADEALKIVADIGRGDMRVFFKVVEEWTFYPLPSHEIIGQKEVVDESDPDHPKTRISYWVRHVALDMDKVIDPQYSHLIREFTDSPKNGLGIKLYDKHSAARDVLKIAGKFTDKVQVTGNVGIEVVRKLVGVDTEKL